MTDSKDKGAGHRALNIAIFCTIFIVWNIVDRLTKLFFGEFAVGETVSSPIPGIIDFTVMHNTGGAWGMLGDATPFLAIISAVVCIAGFVYIAANPKASILATVGISLVVAGGFGNLWDRIELGYVIDFIAAAFIDFPIFNVADIGVTCGVVLFILSLFLDYSCAPSDDQSSVAQQSEERD